MAGVAEPRAGRGAERSVPAAAARKVAWVLGGVLLVLVGARWGTEVSTSRRIQELEERLRLLEAEQLDWRRNAEQFRREEREKIDICISTVHHEAAGWRFLRADGSEAAFIAVEVRNATPVDSEAVASRRASETAGQCVVNITMTEETGSLEVRHLSGEVSEVRRLSAPGGSPVEPASEVESTPIHPNVTAASAEQPPSGQSTLASALMRAPAHALLPTSQAHGAHASSKSVAYPELSCHQNGEWVEVKSATALQFGSWRAGVEVQDAGQLQVLVDSAVRRLSTHASTGGASECGMGRLCMSLLAVLAGGTGGTLLGAHALHSPLLTVLLDVPWRLLVHSGWPIFGMLAQLHLRARERQTAPTVGPAAVYFHDLTASLERRDAKPHAQLERGLATQEAARIAHLGAAFLRSDEGRIYASDHVIPGLCALASQLLSPEVGTTSMPMEDALQQVQGFFRQAVQSIEDLQGTLDSAWPLYSVLHLAVLQVHS